MVVCPVCEHAQAGGLECEVCGRPLPTAPQAALAIAPLEGLEPTLQPAAAEAAGGEGVPGLEPTLQPAAAAADGEAVPGLERTPAAPVDPTIEPIADVERLGEGTHDLPTLIPAVIVCRYCRTPAAPGEKLCGRCGMRLPTLGPAAAAPQREEPTRLCTCGTPIRGPLCPSCGARVG